jgi:hypothetical protein
MSTRHARKGRPSLDAAEESRPIRRRSARELRLCAPPGRGEGGPVLWRGGFFLLPDGGSLELPAGTRIVTVEGSEAFEMTLPDQTVLHLTPPEHTDCSYLVEAFRAPSVAPWTWPRLEPPPAWRSDAANT